MMDQGLDDNDVSFVGFGPRVELGQEWGPLFEAVCEFLLSCCSSDLEM